MPIDATDPAGDTPEGFDGDVDDELDPHDAADERTGDALDDDLDDIDDDIDDDAEMDTDAALIARAKKKYGIGGAMLAGGMLGLDRMLTGKVKQDAPVEWA